LQEIVGHVAPVLYLHQVAVKGRMLVISV